MRILLVAISLLSTVVLSAQQISWQGKVLDDTTGDPIPFAVLWDEAAKVGASAGVDGSFVIFLQRGKGYNFKVSEVSYLGRNVRFAPNEIETLSIRLDVELRKQVLNVGTANVSTIQTVYADPKLHVADFAFMGDQTLLLTYTSQKFTKPAYLADQDVFEGCELVMLSAIGEILLERSLEMPCLNLFLDYRGDVYLRTLGKDYLLEFEGEHLFLAALKKEELETYVRPVVDSLEQHLYVSTFVSDFPAFEYLAVDVRDTSRTRLRYVVDEILMEQFKSEYKWLTPRQKLEAFRAEVYHGIEKEIAGAYISGFTNSIYWDELYAPMAIFSDTIYIFDHYANMLFKYSDTHEALTPVEIDYHLGRRSKWEEEVLFDEDSEQAFAYFLEDGHPELKRINLQTGQLGKSYRLTFKFAEDIKVRDGWAYYTYRPHASSQTRYLYRELLIGGDLDAKKE